MTSVAIVTGTNSGIGLHTALELAARGCTVVATVRSLDRAGALRDAARERGVELDIRTLEVTDHEAGRALIDQVVADHGRLDILVNNAGRGCVGTAEDLSMDTVRDQIEVNYLSVVALTQAALPHLRVQGSGTILTVTSVGGVVGQPFADAALAEEYRFRHRTGDAARAFASRSLADLDGSAVLGMTSTWIA